MRRRIGRSHLITIISAILVLIGLIVSFIYKDTNKMITLITTLTAVVGAFAVYIQIRKSKLIGQSSFTVEISKYFYDVPGMNSFVHKLGRAADVDNTEYEVKKEERPILIKYLNYLKTMATLVNEHVLSIETLNNVFAYEFFIVVNNKSVQELELQPYSEFYSEIYDLYEDWTKYRKKHNLPELSDEHPLDKLPEYRKYVGMEA